MRHLAAVVSALSLLAACSGSSQHKESLEDVTARLLRQMPSGDNLLMISVGGEGSGQVTTPDAALSWLGDDKFEKSDVTGAYWAYVLKGTTVTLTATASTGSTFTGWFGTCTGVGTCQVTLGDNVSVGATFDSTGVGGDPTRAVLTVVTTGHGAGTVTGGGITCTTGSRAGCSAVVPVTRPLQSVTLHATPDASSIFQGWAGSCGGTGDCTVTMDQARSAYATFAPKVLTVRVRIDGTGTVTGPNGFTCSSASGCDLMVQNTTPAQQVVLSASPVATFVTWTGACSGWEPSCTLTVDDDKNLFASWGGLLNHLSSPGSGDVVVFAETNGDHGGDFTITESCSTCHYLNLVTQHARQCALCHAGARPAQALIGAWNKGCSQGACHPSVHTASTGTDHFMMWQNSSAACDRCHDTGGGSFPGSGDNCARCHDPSFTAAAVGDQQAPTTTSNALSSYVGGSTIHLTATDAGTAGVSVTWFSLDGRGWVLGTDAAFSAPATGSRAHSLQFYSVDHALNAEAVKSVAFTVQAPPAADTTAPTTIVSPNPAAGAVYRVSTAFFLTASDNASGVKATYYRVDGGGFLQGTSFSVSGDGLHTFAYYSVDNANNTEATHTSSTFRIDTVAPVTSSTAVNGTAYVGAQTFTLAASDSGSGVASTWYSLDGGAFAIGTSVPVAAPASGSASHLLAWYSIDVAGNQETTKSVSFTVQAPVVADTTAPATSSSFNPVAGTNLRASQLVTLTASDAGSGVKATYYRIDTGAFLQGTSFTVAGEGLHTFAYYSVDNANNTEGTHTSSQFRIDATAPVTTATASNGATYTGAQTFTLAAADGGSGVASTWYKLDSGAFAIGTSIPVAAPASGSASHVLSWYSIDNAGNQEATRSATFTVAAGVAPPPTVTLSFRTNASFGGWSYVTWEVHDAGGNVVNDVNGNACTWWNDDPGHPSSMWIDYVVPAGAAYTMFGAWGPMPDGPDVDSGTRSVSAAEAAPGATITWWWQ